MTPASVHVAGIGCWTPALPGWPPMRAALRGETVAATPQRRPTPALLGANERRRAPDAVLVALDVAAQAVAAAGVDPATVPSVFTSAHGDLAVVDALCTTLAADPAALSPTRFHHSVHNAASGYWAIATGCRAPSSAVAAGAHSFAAGWLEATAICSADATPVLLVGTDTEAQGLLMQVNASRGLLGVALLLLPRPSARSRRIDWRVGVAAAPTPARSAAAQALAGNPMAQALPLLEALAVRGAATCTLALGTDAGLTLALASSPP